MQEINFLPQEYHEAAVKRQGKLWHLIVLVLFGSIVGTATLMQLAARRHVMTQLAEVEPQFQAAMDATTELAQRQEELKEVAAQAQLCVYLESHWPTTQILTNAIAGVPESVRLTQLQFGRHNQQGQPGMPSGRPPALRGNAAEQAEQALAALSEAQRDLVAVRESDQQEHMVVYLEGIASNSTELHAYTSALAQQPLLAKAELLSLEGTQRGDSTVSNFRLRLVVRPSIGKPAPATQPTSATASLTDQRP